MIVETVISARRRRETSPPFRAANILIVIRGLRLSYGSLFKANAHRRSEGEAGDVDLNQQGSGISGCRREADRPAAKVSV